MPKETEDFLLMAQETVHRLIALNITVSTMESCTGGLLSSCISDTEGSSAVFPGGFVTYSNRCKEMLGVPQETIAAFGVYSAETAEAMAAACRGILRTDIGVGITGTFSNPDPANGDSVPGEVIICTIYGDRKKTEKVFLPKGADRRKMKACCVKKACELICALIEEKRM